MITEIFEKLKSRGDTVNHDGIENCGIELIKTIFDDYMTGGRVGDEFHHLLLSVESASDNDPMLENIGKMERFMMYQIIKQLEKGRKDAEAERAKGRIETVNNPTETLRPTE